MARNTHRQNRIKNPWISVLILLIFAVISVFQNTDILDRLPGYSITVPGTAAVAGDGELLIRLLDVGQADCILITEGDEAMLIDTGDPGDEEIILPALDSYGVERLDYLVLTHPHSDHIGSAVEVLDALPVEAVILSDAPYTTKLYENTLSAIEESGAEVFLAVPGDDYTLGEATFEILAPSKDTDVSDINDASVCLRLTYQGRTALFTGDATRAVESEILDAGFDVHADIYKAGHHGSATSNAQTWLNAVDPSYVFISCREDSDDNLPNPDVLKRLVNTGADIYRSDIHGVITASIRSGEITITTEREAA